MGIGFKNELLVRIVHDMQRFKDLTTGEGGNYVLMGRKTYQSLPSKLKNRTNIIVSRNKKFEQPVGTFLYQSIADVITEYTHYNDDNKELWIIGGSDVYKQTIDYADKIYLTVVNHEFKHVDSYFPKFDVKDWKITDISEHYIDEESKLEYHFVTYERIK